MKRNKTLILSAVLLLVVLVSAIIVIRRRGRKVYLKTDFRASSPDKYDDVYVYLYSPDLDSSIYYKDILDYVVLPFDYKKKVKSKENTAYISSKVDNYYPVIAIGYKHTDGKIRRENLKEISYIKEDWLEID